MPSRASLPSRAPGNGIEVAEVLDSVGAEVLEATISFAAGILDSVAAEVLEAQSL